MNNNFQPFQRVLVRNDNYEKWIAAFFSHIEKTPANNTIYISTNGNHWFKCIPYEGNEKFHNTNNKPEM